MGEIKQIDSLQNSLVKKILVLKEKSRERKKEGLFILEGWRELKLAIKGGYEIDTLLFLKELVPEFKLMELFGDNTRPRQVSVSKEVYQKLAYREGTEGVLAIARCKPHTLDSIILDNSSPLILIAEAPEKPGNIGAMLRTADAAHLDAVIIADPKTDLYNPNIVRSSVGCLFTTQIATGTTVEVLSFLKRKKIGIYCAALSSSKNYLEVDFKGPSAIVVGAESTGLTTSWIQNSDENILIPMKGEIDSMNVSVSAAILIFEAKRQRGL